MKLHGENEIPRNEQEFIKENNEKLMKEEQKREKSKHEKNRLSKEKQVEDNRLANDKAKEAERIQKENEEASKRRRKKQNEKKLSVAGRGNDAGTQLVRVAEQYVHVVKDSINNISRMAKAQKEMSERGKDLISEKAAPKLSSKAECVKVIREHDILKAKVDNLDKINKALSESKDNHLIKNLNVSKKNIEEYIEKNYGLSKEKPKVLQSKGKLQSQEKEYRGQIQDKLQEFDNFKEQASDMIKGYQPKKDYINFEKEVKGMVQDQLKAQNHTQEQGRER